MKRNKGAKILLIEEMSSIEIEAFLASGKPLFLPIGTLEAHGRHLPVGTDSLCAYNFAKNLTGEFDGALAPTLSYGITNLFAQTAPASFFDETLFENFVFAIVENFVKHGFNRIIIVNGHGGNMPALKNVARKLTKSSAVAIAVLNWWLSTESEAESIYKGSGGHAAAEETAAMLFFRKDLVNQSLYEPEQDDYIPTDGFWCFPPPGEVLLYASKKTSPPDFNKSKAREFMNCALSKMKARISVWLSCVSKIHGGLRPSANSSLRR